MLLFSLTLTCSHTSIIEIILYYFQKLEYLPTRGDMPLYNNAHNVAVDYVGAMLAPCYAGSCHGAGLSVSARTRGSQGRARALLGA